VLDWFAHFGYNLPHGISTADFVLDLAMGEAEVGRGLAGGMAAVRGLYGASERFNAQAPLGFSGSTRDWRVLAGEWPELDAEVAAGEKQGEEWQ
jgi:hypothetical protein